MNPTSPRQSLAAAVLFGGVAFTTQAQTLVDFDASSDLSAFTESGVSLNAQFAVNTTLAGVGGVNGVLLAGQNVDETLVFTGVGGTTTWAANPTQTLSVFFQHRGTFSSATLVYAQIGLLAASSQSFNSPGGDYASARVRYQNTGTVGFEFQGQSATNAGAGSAVNVNTQSGLSLTLNNWYRLQVTFSKGATNVLNYSAALDGFGATGDSLVGNVSNISGTQAVSSTLYNDNTALYFGLRSTIGSSQGYLDNLTAPAAAIPEPAGFAAFAGVGMLGWAATRRRARRS